MIWLGNTMWNQYTDVCGISMPIPQEVVICTQNKDINTTWTKHQSKMIQNLTMSYVQIGLYEACKLCIQIYQ